MIELCVWKFLYCMTVVQTQYRFTCDRSPRSILHWNVTRGRTTNPQSLRRIRERHRHNTGISLIRLSRESWLAEVEFPFSTAHLSTQVGYLSKAFTGLAIWPAVAALIYLPSVKQALFRNDDTCSRYITGIK